MRALLWIFSAISIASGEYTGSVKDKMVYDSLEVSKKELSVMKVENSELERMVREAPKEVVKTDTVYLRTQVVKYIPITQKVHDTLLKRDTLKVIDWKVVKPMIK